MKSEATVPQNVMDGLLKQCISSTPCKFKSVEKIILYKINFSLVYMWEVSLIGVYCDFKLKSHVLTETEAQPYLNVWLQSLQLLSYTNAHVGITVQVLICRICSGETKMKQEPVVW